MTTIDKLGKEWRISFYFKPSDLDPKPEPEPENERSDLAPDEGDIETNTTNLLLLDQSGNGEDSWEEHGDRILSINFAPEKGMIFDTSIESESKYVNDFKTKIEVSQIREAGKYLYKILVGGKELHSVENQNPMELKNVSVYASSSRLPSTIGQVRDLQMETSNGGISIIDHMKKSL